MSARHHALAGPAYQTLRRMIFDRDGWRCKKCGKAGRLELDHITPLECGGAHEAGNLQTLCRGCHIAKTRAERLDNRRRRPVAPAVAAWGRLVAELT